MKIKYCLIFNKFSSISFPKFTTSSYFYVDPLFSFIYDNLGTDSSGKNKKSQAWLILWKAEKQHQRYIIKICHNPGPLRDAC